MNNNKKTNISQESPNKIKNIPTINIPKNNNEFKLVNSNYNNNSIYISKSHKNKNKNNINKKEEEKNNVKNNAILQNLNKIFLNSSQYNSKDKDYFLNRYQILDILTKSNIISKKIISKTQADIILTQLNPHKRKYNLKDFMNYLTELCHYIYKDNFESSPKETMDYFLKCLFNNYKDALEEKNSNNFLEKTDDSSCTIKCLEIIITSELEEPICKLLLTLYESFKKIYKIYFPNELTRNVIVDKELLLLSSSENLLQFSKDFEIMPYIINKTNLNIYFNFLIKYQNENPEIIKTIMNSGNKKYKDIGIIFKLSSFILFIYHFSNFLYYKDFRLPYANEEYEITNDVDKIIFFLQKLENSIGIKKYLDKRGRTNENKFSFIPSNKNIEIANEEMNKNKNKNKIYITDIEEKEKENNLKGKSKKYNIESSPYTSKEVTERKIDNNNYYINKNKSFSFNNEKLVKDNNLNNYFKEKTKKEKDYLSISELKKILNVSPSIQNDIINNIENLSEIFLKYSKIHDKLDYNKMTISSFIQFLKDTNILSSIPDEQRNNFRKLSNKLIRKNYNISEIKKYDQTLKGSVSCNNINLANDIRKYKKNISQYVNTNNLKDKINIGEASVIFFSLTNPNNLPSNKNKIRTQFDNNAGYKHININKKKKKTLSFDSKRENFIQKNIPNKMNFVLFIKSFELIAIKLYPDMTLDDAVSNLLNKKILPFIKEKNINIINSKEMKDALSKMNNDNIKQFLIKLGDAIAPLYNIFSDNNNNMKFYQYFDFYKCFGLFPELISLSQLKAIFFTLCESVTLENNNKSDKKIEQIDFSLFLESLGISSMFFNFKNIISDIDRLLYLCYSIWKSDGIKKQKIEENIPQKINSNFIELFKYYNRIDMYNDSGKKNRESKRKLNYNNSCSNLNFNRHNLILSYDNINNEYNCTKPNRGVYKFDDIYN